ncbi:MAG: hypothetical protein H7123_07765 [Thermoleophilia bacterium]|nr:hypothetical protein [Thermoleophilia bacterium]
MQNSNDDHNVQSGGSQTDWADIVLAALRGGAAAHARFLELATSVSATSLCALAAEDPGGLWATAPRPSDDDTGELLLLHCVARIHRMDGAAPHIDSDLYLAVMATLAANRADWPDVAVAYWRQWVLHLIEAEAAWPHAERLISQFADAIDARPGIIGCIASIASRAGDVAAADKLWARALEHPVTRSDPRQHWDTHSSWARYHLLGCAGEPLRAITELERAYSAFGALGDPQAMLSFVDVALDLVWAHAWVGDPERAIEVSEASRADMTVDGEYSSWVIVSSAWPHAELGEHDVAIRAMSAVSGTGTDIAALILAASGPAQLILAARSGDRGAVIECIDHLLRIEAEKKCDDELRVLWRIHAIRACLGVGLLDDAGALIDEATEFGTTPLPVHHLYVRALATRLTADRELASPVAQGAALDELRAEARRTRRQWIFDSPIASPIVPTETAPGPDALAISLFGEFRIRHGELDVLSSAWRGRRQARLVLAALVAAGGRLQRSELSDLLWGDDVDPQLVRLRLNPLCAVIRRVLGVGAGEGEGGERALVLRDAAIELKLGPGDMTDVARIRDIDQRAQSGALATSQALRELAVLGTPEPLSGLGEEAIVQFARAWIDRELSAVLLPLVDGQSEQFVDESLVLVLTRLHLTNPTDEAACARLLRLLAAAGRIADATRVFHYTREAYSVELGLSPSRELVELHASVIAIAGSVAPRP